MAPIINRSINERVLFAKNLRKNLKTNSNNSSQISSTSSGASFSSFGEMSLDEAMLIINPCDYTLEDFEREEPSDNPYKIPGSEEESIAVIQKGLIMAFRDPEQKKRHDYLKANGMYYNSSGLVNFGLNASSSSRPSFLNRLSKKLWSSGSGKKSKKSSTTDYQVLPEEPEEIPPQLDLFQH